MAIDKLASLIRYCMGQTAVVDCDGVANFGRAFRKGCPQYLWAKPILLSTPYILDYCSGFGYNLQRKEYLLFTIVIGYDDLRRRDGGT